MFKIEKKGAKLKNWAAKGVSGPKKKKKRRKNRKTKTEREKEKKICFFYLLIFRLLLKEANREESEKIRIVSTPSLSHSAEESLGISRPLRLI